MCSAAGARGSMALRSSFIVWLRYIAVRLCCQGRVLLRGSTLVLAAMENSSGSPKRSEEHTSELQSRLHLVCRLLLEKKKNIDFDTFVIADAPDFILAHETHQLGLQVGGDITDIVDKTGARGGHLVYTALNAAGSIQRASARR